RGRAAGRGEQARREGERHGDSGGPGRVGQGTRVRRKGRDQDEQRTDGDRPRRHLPARAGFFFSSRRRHTMWPRDWSSDVCSSDLVYHAAGYSHHSLIVEFPQWLALVDSPYTETQAKVLFRAIQEQFPAKPVKYVAVSHHQDRKSVV